ncbi:conserved hypothetical protein [Trichinella spiralis]|uniref:hypothetical protein n=1 Tax=Trichinella spiralis TaxID=6334 RepID=UPI0001EFEBC9|nr:conserved hypothetical protein [Trichinella spiralis]
MNHMKIQISSHVGYIENLFFDKDGNPGLYAMKCFLFVKKLAISGSVEKQLLMGDYRMY